MSHNVSDYLFGRFLERLKVPVDSQEMLQREWGLALARSTVAIACLIAAQFDFPEPVRYFNIVLALLVGYGFYSVAVLILLQFWKRPWAPFYWFLHVTDIIWLACVTSLTEGPNSVFFYLASFVLLAAGYRWGLRQTMFTAITALLLVLTEAFLLQPGFLSSEPLIEGNYELNRLIIRSVSILVLGILIGWLAEQEKQRRAEAAVLYHIVRKAEVKGGLRRAIQEIVEEFLEIWETRQIDRKSTRLNSSHIQKSRMPSSA